LLFSSWGFIALFLPITWGIWYTFHTRYNNETALTWLIIASFFFYAWLKPIYIFIILGSIIINFIICTQLQNKEYHLRNKQFILFVGISANLLILAYFKYTALILKTLNNFGSDYSIPNIALPLAISFFTFQQIACLVDAYHKKAKELNFLHYCLFVTFFPQLIAGPIVHHKDMLPQLVNHKKGSITIKHFTLGITVFLIGLFKKVAIADYLAEIADPMFTMVANNNTIALFEAWVGVIAYSLQIYFDFSGYSDMAIGLGMLFGVKLPLNFFSPYKADSIIEFWRRWHITLSSFLKDYLYIPLGGNRSGVFRRYMNLIIVMLLGGLWHGAQWTFAVWGGLHGIFLIINHTWRKYMPFALPKFLAIGLTFLATTFAWIFFRADSFDSAFRIIEAMIGQNGIALTNVNGYFAKLLEFLGADIYEISSRLLRLNERWYIFWVALFIAFFAPSTHEFMSKKLALDTTKVAEQYNTVPWLRWSLTKRWALLIGFLSVLSFILLTRVNAFIYFQF